MRCKIFVSIGTLFLTFCLTTVFSSCVVTINPNKKVQVTSKDTLIVWVANPSLSTQTQEPVHARIVNQVLTVENRQPNIVKTPFNYSHPNIDYSASTSQLFQLRGASDKSTLTVDYVTIRSTEHNNGYENWKVFLVLTAPNGSSTAKELTMTKTRVPGPGRTYIATLKLNEFGVTIPPNYSAALRVDAQQQTHLTVAVSGEKSTVVSN